MTERRIAVIGAGLAGLAAARTLVDAGRTVVVFEKSRGLGGRLATRRTRDGLAFDHGAPAVHGEDAGFRAFLDAATAAGAAARFGDGTVGLPGMSGLVAPLARGLDIRLETEIDAIAADARGWRVAGERFAAVICAAPAPQTARIAAAAPKVAEAARTALMAPCWTLMAAWDASGRASAAAAPFAAILPMHERPGRDALPRRWVAHATQDWTEANLERDREDAAAALLPALAGALSLDPAAAVAVAAHRWRFARAARAVGTACVADDGVAACGDWLLGPDAGDAWRSGVAAAKSLA